MNQELKNCPFCQELLPTNDMLNAEGEEEKIMAIVKQYNKEIYENVDKLTTLINTTFEQARLLVKIIQDAKASQLVYAVRASKNKHLEKDYAKILENVATETFISPEVIKPALNLLFAGLGVTLGEYSQPISKTCCDKPTKDEDVNVDNKGDDTSISDIEDIEFTIFGFNGEKQHLDNNTSPTPTQSSTSIPSTIDVSNLTTSSSEEFEITNNILVKYTGSSNIVVVPEDVKVIGERAFNWCENLVAITLPTKLAAIKAKAFYGCKNLNTIELPDTLVVIEENAFAFCESLIDIKLPKNLTKCENFVFNNCVSLKTVEIKSQLKEISYGLFSNCRNLVDVKIPHTVTEIKDYAFYLCTSLSTINVPANVKIIGTSAFEECVNLNTIEIPKSVTTINDKAFNYCIKLAKLDLTSEIKTLGCSSFGKCESLDEKTVKSIEKIRPLALS